MEKLPVELQPGESIVLRVRRAPVIFWAKLIGILLACAVPVAALLCIVSATAGLGGVPGTVALIIAGLWALFWLVRAYLTWYRHMNDEWIVTDQRLIDSFRSNWFNQKISSADLVNLQDLAVSRKGLLASVFNYGDVICQTAGTDARFVLSDVPKPAEIMRVIDGTRDAARGAVYDTRRIARPRPPADDEPAGRPRPQFVPRAAPPDNLGATPPRPE